MKIYNITYTLLEVNYMPDLLSFIIPMNLAVVKNYLMLQLKMNLSLLEMKLKMHNKFLKVESIVQKKSHIFNKKLINFVLVKINY